MLLVSFYYYIDRAVTLSESAWQIDKLGKEIAVGIFFLKKTWLIEDPNVRQEAKYYF